MDANSVLALARKTWGSDGHIWTTADMLTAGLTAAEMKKFRESGNTADNHGPVNAAGSVWFLDAEIMTLIAYHESNFNERAHGTGPVDDSYGLWQINTLGPLWAILRNRYHVLEKSELYNPEVNAKVAHAYTTERPGSPAITFQPWTGSWQKAAKDIGKGTAVIPVGTVASPGNATPGIGSTDTTIPDMRGFLSAIGDFFNVILDATWWKRLGIGALGFVVVGGALVLYNKDEVIKAVGMAPK